MVFIIFFTLCTHILIACNCLEAEINGSQCVVCDPDGWSAVSLTPDIMEFGSMTFTAFCPGTANSSDGGGFIHMGPTEATSYEFSGLIPGTTYFFRL